MKLRTEMIAGAVALVLAAAAAAGWRLQQGSAEQTYEAAAAAGADHGDQAMTLLRQACEEGSRRACETLRDGGGPGAILH